MSLGFEEGTTLGSTDGMLEGELLPEGILLGLELGTSLGCTEGSALGPTEGELLGLMRGVLIGKELELLDVILLDMSFGLEDGVTLGLFGCSRLGRKRFFLTPFRFYSGRYLVGSMIFSSESTTKKSSRERDDNSQSFETGRDGARR